MTRLSIKLAAMQAKTTLVVIMTVQNMMKPITTKQEKEAPSLTSPSTWPKRETKTLLQVMEIKTTTEALSRMSLMQFSHTCLKALLRMWMIITISTIKTLINSNPTKTMVIKFHINKINSLIKMMDNTMIKINSNITKRATNSMTVKMNTMINIINKVMELSLI